MGYTRYWHRTDNPITGAFLDEVKKILEDCKNRGITICNWDGQGEPTLTLERIALNGFENKRVGNLTYDLSHESFVLDSETGYNFCKTNRKPYDYAVRKILKVAKEHGLVTNVRSDGAERHIYSDERYIKG